MSDVDIKPRLESGMCHFEKERRSNPTLGLKVAPYVFTNLTVPYRGCFAEKKLLDIQKDRLQITDMLN